MSYLSGGGSALDGYGVVNATPPGRFTESKETRYLLCRRLDGRRVGVDGCEDEIISCAHPGFEPLTVQPVASRCTDYVISVR